MVVARVRAPRTDWVGADLLHGHHVKACKREGEHRAATALEEEAGHRALADLAWVDAAALADVALAAHKILDAAVVLFEHRLSRPACGAPIRRAAEGEAAA